jgi:biopolymer transport protein ExbB/TolQ
MAWCGIMRTIERSIKYASARHQSQAFVREVAVALHNHNLEQAMAIAGRYVKSPSARVAESGLASFQTAMPLLTDAETIETTQHAMRRSAGLVHGELNRGLALLASVGCTAPLVGAFGTILSIVDSFVGFDGALWTIVAYQFECLAKALVLTALSLIQGILTMWCYKYLTSELDAFDMEMRNESARLVNYLVIHLEQQR